MAALTAARAVALTALFYMSFNTMLVRSLHATLGDPSLSVPTGDPGPTASKPTEVREECGPEQAWCYFRSENAPPDDKHTHWKEDVIDEKGDHLQWDDVIPAIRQLHSFPHISIGRSGDDPIGCTINLKVKAADDYEPRVLAYVTGARPNAPLSWVGLYTLSPSLQWRGLIYTATDDSGDQYLERCPETLQRLNRFDGVLNKHIDALRDRTKLHHWLLATFNGEVQWLIVAAVMWCGMLLTNRFTSARDGNLGRHAENSDQFRVLEWIDRQRSVPPACSPAPVASQEQEIEMRGRTGAVLMEVEQSRALENWLLEALPLLGFVGTVLGMIEAMSFVGEVVAAQPGIQLATAMGKVTGALAIAFRTTLLSIVFFIPLSRVAAIVYRYEERGYRGILLAKCATALPP